MFNINDKIKNKHNKNTGIFLGYSGFMILVKIDQFDYSYMKESFSYCVPSDWTVE